MTQQNAPISESQSTGRTTLVAYEGRDVRITDPRGNTTTRTQNVIGQLKAMVDPSPGGTTSYSYKPFGELASITDASSNTSSWTYNLRGFVTQTVDPDAGTWNYVPNAFGELISQTNAKSQQVTFTYDKLSRPLTRVEPEGTTTWTWGTSSGSYNIGRLALITSPWSYSESYTYDDKGRPSQQSVTADGTAYSINRTYDPYTGLPATLQYPTSTSGYRLTLAYDYASNLLQKVRDANGSTVFWQATSTDAWGHIQDEAFGNGVSTFTDFDQANGGMEARQGGIGGGTGLLNATASWDVNGNLTQRQDLKQSVTETFYYDALNRFDYSQRNGVINQDVTLDAIGNLTWKMGIGNYTYHATKRRAVITAGSNSYGYDANGNMNSRLGSSIIYASYDLPTGINAPGGYSSTIAYGAFRNRYKQIAVSASGTETTIYVGGILEKVTKGGVTAYRHLVHGGKGIAAIYTRRTSGSPLTDTFYVHADHLGSPELITNAAGAQVVKLSFGAYGERRDSDWDGAVSSGDMTTIGNTIRHGFTGHEHLDSVNLVHMNGRVYDPVVGRFLSADPIAVVGSGQGANSYAYVMNNPLNYTDPSGFECQDPDGNTQTDCGDYLDRWDVDQRDWWDECDWGGPWVAGCNLDLWRHRHGSPTFGASYEDYYDGGDSGGGEAEALGEVSPTGGAAPVDVVFIPNRYSVFAAGAFDYHVYVVTRDASGAPVIINDDPFEGSLSPDIWRPACADGACPVVAEGRYPYVTKPGPNSYKNYLSLYLGTVPTLGPNYSQNAKRQGHYGQSIATEVYCHPGGRRMTTSEGCLTVKRNSYAEFIGLIPSGSKGDVIVAPKSGGPPRR